ncbi:Putative F-box domain protein [[Torrubiella] hemipterigena]|uniref:Putative F-box domain protein n=1 Tax=[Torrubiella] hemipterigena TaxID=1531966 RepID=A0A0A1TQA3_9HYPO|nr:Putative F-box domain protein [[Torrubiella] hemipterigena]
MALYSAQKSMQSGVVAAESDDDKNNDRTTQTNLMSLPLEIHYMISEHLIYPDALSLKHVNRHFAGIVDTGVKLKIAWLIQRRQLHLECPNDRTCDLGSDIRFCRGSVPLLMARRREHFECESRAGLGCLVFGTPKCVHKPKQQYWWKKRFQLRLTVEVWWIVIAAVPLLLMWLLCL